MTGFGRFLSKTSPLLLASPHSKLSISFTASKSSRLPSNPPSSSPSGDSIRPASEIATTAMFQFDRTALWPRSAVGVKSMMDCAVLAIAGLSAKYHQISQVKDLVVELEIPCVSQDEDGQL
ncbi:hypothetical protein I305_05294 [Cryptococcus gattii E566]|uniref:Uncharacterized protein n=1 Tax=Cryptococcus gattii serotype B (strain WM276 / ATCC MYA-4071) TaxID=367775 RepID=E6R7L9_CRYGW|nr:Hypothetical Protein CGB_F0380C [Cryptococcus gattii WM276]ADV22798.1 Hypothetical Protein CGB_F0380C [Cryptococcus gattii WM276]KIY32335.1 hypothetical protein I305_05294 [Cryptococcus gattii E566]